MSAFASDSALYAPEAVPLPLVITPGQVEDWSQLVADLCCLACALVAYENSLQAKERQHDTSG